MGCIDKCGSNVVRSSSFGRKRVALPNGDVEFGDDGGCTMKKWVVGAGKSALENLPQEILVSIVCGVEHDDLRSLLSVSKSIREAALIAKETHFAYTTPRKAVGCKTVENLDDPDGMEAPNAPKHRRVSKFRLSGTKLADISVALFRDLVLEMETGE